MSAPWLNGLPWTPYTYRGTGTDTLTAWMDGEPDIPFRVGRPASQPCGTEAGFRRHVRHGEKPVRNYCQECADANVEAVQARNTGSGSAYNKRRRERYQQAREAGLPRDEALSRRDVA